MLTQTRITVSIKLRPFLANLRGPAPRRTPALCPSFSHMRQVGLDQLLDGEVVDGFVLWQAFAGSQPFSDDAGINSALRSLVP
jgi:hypothetical protein